MAKKPKPPAPPARFPSYKSLIRHFDTMPDHIRWHFPDLEKLLRDQYPFDIPLAYLFLKIELAYNRSLYGGLVRQHRVDTTFARRILNLQHLTREGYRDLFDNVYGLQPAGKPFIERAEETRDKVIHGKKMEPAQLREAIGDALDFCLQLHNQILNIAGFTPFGDMRGFAAKKDLLDASTSKWVMRGMGFAVKR
jgi:hypothetical protein